MFYYDTETFIRPELQRNNGRIFKRLTCTLLVMNILERKMLLKYLIFPVPYNRNKPYLKRKTNNLLIN